MSAHLKSKKYDYAMYGGVEDDASLDIVKYKLEIAFPVEESSNGVYKLGSVNIDLNDDLYITPPSTVYAVDWGDGMKSMLCVNRYTGDWHHTYSMEDGTMTTKVFDIVIKGNDLPQHKNDKKAGYIAKVEHSNYTVTLRSGV